MNKKLYTLFYSACFSLLSITTFAQQSNGSIVLTNFADSVYTTGTAGEFQDYEFEQGQTVNVKGMYADLATAVEVNVNYTIFAPDWSGVLYEHVEVFASEAIGNLDGVIDFDFVIPMDADTAGQHDIDTMTVALDYIQVRVVHEDAAGLDVFWYEFVQVRPEGTLSSTNDITPLEGLQVFPNPASDELTIQTPSYAPKNVMVYDPSGRRVLMTEMTGNRLDISSLQSGFHIIRVEQEEKIGIYKVMIK